MKSLFVCGFDYDQGKDSPKSLGSSSYRFVLEKTFFLVLMSLFQGGVQAAILLDLQGSMLAFSGEDMNTNQMVSAIVANLWVCCLYVVF